MADRELSKQFWWSIVRGSFVRWSFDLGDKNFGGHLSGGHLSGGQLSGGHLSGGHAIVRLHVSYMTHTLLLPLKPDVSYMIQYQISRLTDKLTFNEFFTLSLLSMNSVFKLHNFNSSISWFWL